MKVTIEINVGSTGFAQAYTLFTVRAPRAYDYHGVINVEDGGDSRIVAIPDEDVAIQTARYASGLYGVEALSDYADESTLVDLLVARLINGGRS